MSRAFHGETIREKQWTRMFRPGIRAVVPMDYNYLAEHDGAEQAAGRGSGVDKPIDSEDKVYPRTPYLSNVYAQMERRLDTAIFRALFASSTRQARQFVVHGNVKVNGKMMIYPGYQLNPGDMFQVEPDRVMFATGAPKDSKERRAGRQLRARVLKEKEANIETEGNEEDSESTPDTAQTPTAAAVEEMTPEQETKQRRASLQDLMKEAKALLENPSPSLSAKRKQDLRAFQRTVRKAMPRSGSGSVEELDAQLRDITNRLAQPNAPPPADEVKTSSLPAEEMPELSTPSLRGELDSLKPDQLRTLRRALIEAKENPIDPSKSYATPWRPREFMSAFAFVPRYLEVHPKVCAAVYLRHPVARPGLAEVPSPFPIETLSLAHTWYLRRR